jgi:hypothetical protein
VITDKLEDRQETKQKNWFAKHKVLTVIIILVAIVIISKASGGGSTSSATSSTSSGNSGSTSAKAAAPMQTPQSTPKPAVRQVEGTAVTLGAGTFAGGKDVAVGLYDVTPGAGQSGNFIVTGTDSYNEILGVSDGQGVPKVRVTISSGDSIQISSLSQVTFSPVTTPFVTSQQTTNLYAGTFTVGQDIAAGRYVATPGSGQTGNFIVTGNDSYNEILGGDASMGGVPNVTVDLTDGDIIDISGLSQVSLTPSN